MQKKSKTIVTAVVTALFVLSVSYFALLAPTTAWYYQEDNKDYSFSFGNWSVSEQPYTTYNANSAVRLRGATRFADAGEVLFDEMIHVVKVTATNTGELDGVVNVSVVMPEPDENDPTPPPDLRWFAYGADVSMDPTAVAPVLAANTLKIANASRFTVSFTLKLTVSGEENITITKDGEQTTLTPGDHTLTFSNVGMDAVHLVGGLPADIPFTLTVTSGDVRVEGGKQLKATSGTVPAAGRNIRLVPSFKAAIERGLGDHNVTPLDYKKDTTAINALSGATYDARYETYNTSAITALSACNSESITIEPDLSTHSSVKYIYVVFWSEYGDVKASGYFDADNSARSLETLEYNPVTIHFIATPDRGQTSTMTITNSASSTATVRLYQWQQTQGANNAIVWDWVLLDRQPAAVTGNITITSGSTATISDLVVGTQYKLVIQNNPATIHFVVDSENAGTTVMSTVSNTDMAISIAND